MADTDTFFRYRDAEGREVVTNDIADVPPHLRDSVRPLEAAELAPPPRIVDRGRDAVDAVGVIDAGSFALGVACAVPLALVGERVLRRAPRLARLALLAVVVAGGVGLYFGAVLRTAGLSDDVVANPARAVDEARAVRDRANAANAAKERALAE
jgi:hypothetical protein